MASWEKDIIGEDECQKLENGEANLHQDMGKCKKDPSHKGFIPIREFTISHLPEGYRKKDVYQYILAVADLTVRIGVEKISLERQTFYYNSRHLYSFHDVEGSSGSGMIKNVFHYTNGVSPDRLEHSDYKKCWCKQCETSDSPSEEWWEFNVVTATHVVFNEAEARDTSVRLFFDQDKCPKIIIDRVRVDIADRWDKCVLIGATCDRTLGYKLKEMWEHYKNISEKINESYDESKDDVKLTFIVSHPHGCSKHVSLGHWIDTGGVASFLKKFTYTTDTCPGSSGASVHCVGYNQTRIADHLVHRGSLSESKGINHSGAILVHQDHSKRRKSQKRNNYKSGFL